MTANFRCGPSRNVVIGGAMIAMWLGGAAIGMPGMSPDQVRNPHASAGVSSQKFPSVDVPLTFTPGVGPVKVETPEGVVWIQQCVRRPHGDTRGPVYPGCLECHGDLELATENMAGLDLGCTFCHGGDPDAVTKELAHVHPNGNVAYGAAIPPIDDDLEYQRFVNPSNLRAAQDICGMCHSNTVRDLLKSMMATTAGHYSGGFYQNNVVDTKVAIYGTFAIEDDDGWIPDGAVESLLDLLIYDGLGDPLEAATHYQAVPSQACSRCHLWSRGKGYRGAEGQDGLYRADGCAACHMLYDNDGLSQSADTSIDHTQKGHPRIHSITRRVPTEQCLHCHHRGARIGLSFTGRAQMPPRLPSGPGVPGTTDEIFNSNYHYTVADTNPPDIHHELGMHCIDCHVKAEIMGDGNIYSHMDRATKIECRTCHGTPDTPPSMADHDGAPMPNTWQDVDGNWMLTSKVDDVNHQIPLASEVVATNPVAAEAMGHHHLKETGGLECYACHTSWVPNCYGCHFERDETQMGLNYWTGEYEVGKVTTNNKIFEALRQFSIGPNSDGRVAPYIVSCMPIADITAADGTKLLDYVMPISGSGISGLAHNPVQPHTVRGAGEVRTCAECHRSPPTLGFGTGRVDIARTFVHGAGPFGVSTHDRWADPLTPIPEDPVVENSAAYGMAAIPNVIEGTSDYMYVALGGNGVALYDCCPDAPVNPIWTATDLVAIDVERKARFLYVVEAGIGVRVYDTGDLLNPDLVETIPLPAAQRAVQWGIHLFVAMGQNGLAIVDVSDDRDAVIIAEVTGIEAVDVHLEAHYQAGNGFAARAYVADPSYGVRVIDLLPDYESPTLLDGLPLQGGAWGLDGYSRWLPASGTEPSREHDYLYVAGGEEGLYIFDVTEPDAIALVSEVEDLGGFVADVDVSSQLAPPGVDDYAVLANSDLGLQILDVSDPLSPVDHGIVPESDPSDRVFVEVQQLDRFIDEQGVQLKDNSHPNTSVFTRDDIVRLLSTDISSVDPCLADLDQSGDVGTDDLLAIVGAWGPCSGACPEDISGDGIVGTNDLLMVLSSWGPCW